LAVDNQGCGADSFPAVHREYREQAAFHGPAKPDRPVTRQLDWAEDPDPPPARLTVHLSSVTRA
jgi:hypothetical protein